MVQYQGLSGGLVEPEFPVAPELHRILGWYFANVYGRREGPGILPYYCDPARVGSFAVEPAALAAGHPHALFRLFVCMSMYQARRDVVIMAQQRAMPRAAVAMLTSASLIGRMAKKIDCGFLGSGDAFDSGCDVHKADGHADCGHRPGLACPVKFATEVFRRTGDMGKLPVSAWLHLWRGRRFATEALSEVAMINEPSERAVMLVHELSRVYRVGRKLATMYVSALSTPAMAPGLTPWHPTMDGNALVVVDTNVQQVVDRLRGCGPKTYQARADWIRRQAGTIDLRAFRADLPAYSPRLVQQAVYAFRSKSNRRANGEPFPETAVGSPDDRWLQSKKNALPAVAAKC